MGGKNLLTESISFKLHQSYLLLPTFFCDYALLVLISHCTVSKTSPMLNHFVIQLPSPAATPLAISSPNLLFQEKTVWVTTAMATPLHWEAPLQLTPPWCCQLAQSHANSKTGEMKIRQLDILNTVSSLMQPAPQSASTHLQTNVLYSYHRVTHYTQ